MTQTPASESTIEGQQFGNGMIEELGKMHGLIETLVAKTDQLEKLFLKTQLLHDQLEARLDRHDSAMKKQNAKRQVPQNGCRQSDRQLNQKVQTSQTGYYVRLCLNNTPVQFLIDTGAMVTIINEQIWHNIAQGRTLKKTKNVFSTATGSKVKVWGEFDLQFRLPNMNVQHTVTIAKITEPGILGLDFLNKFNWQLMDCATSTPRLTLNDASFELFRSPLSNRRSCFAKSIRRVILNPGQETVFTASVHDLSREKLDQEFLLEGLNTSLKRHGIMIARELIKPNEKGYVPIRVFNGSDVPLTLKPGQRVAVVQPNFEILSNEELSQISAINKETENIGTPNNCVDVPEHLADLYARSLENLNNFERQKLAQFLTSYADVFSKSDSDIGQTDIVQHTIDTGDAPPVRQRPRRFPFAHRQAAAETLKTLLDNSLVKECQSPWAANIVLVKKPDNSLRLCLDYRDLNLATKFDAYPLPRIDEALQILRGSTYYHGLDLASGYWQTRMRPEDEEKTAFIMPYPPGGTYSWKVMPFGLVNAGATFQRLMEKVLGSEINWKIALVYVDDIIVFGNGFDQSLERLGRVLDKIRQANLKLKPRKCKLFQTALKYLGHVVTREGVATDPEKTAAVANWQVPKTKTEMRSFLGFASYYRQFIKHFAQIAKPLHDLTSPKKKFSWSSECQFAFETLKQKLVNAPVLSYPDFSENSGQFLLDCDCSNEAMGAVLSQVQSGVEKPIAFASRCLSKPEKNYCATRKELLSLITFCDHFRHFLLGREFVIRTDHGALKWLLSFRNPTGQIARWIERISEFRANIQYRPGAKHQNADAMSRLPCDQSCEQCRRCERLNQNISSVQKELQTNWSANYTKADLAKEQQNDKDLNLLFQVLSGQKVLSERELLQRGNYFRMLYQQRQNLLVRDEMIYRKFVGQKDGKTIFQFIVPRALRREVLNFAHGNLLSGGHFGDAKTLSKIRQRFYWPGYHNEVLAWIRSCTTCALRKRTLRKPKAPIQNYVAGEFGDICGIDIIGPIEPESVTGKKYIVCCIDYFSKFAEAIPVRNVTAETVARVVVEQYILRHGAPLQIHTDQGPQFESALFQEINRLFDIKKTRSTPYHSQSAGQIERMNGILVQMLRTYVNKKGRDWCQNIPYALMAYRSTVQLTTGFTPNFLCVGRELRTPMSLMYGNTQAHVEADKFSITEKTQEAFQLARQTINEQQRRQKSSTDRKIWGKEISLGDYVSLYTPRLSPGVTRKFFSYKTGPYQVVAKHGMVFTLRRVNHKNLIGPSFKVHYDRLEKLTLFEGELRDVTVENPALKQNVKLDRHHVNDVRDHEPVQKSTDVELCDDPLLSLTDVDQQLNIQSRPERVIKPPNRWGFSQ